MAARSLNPTDIFQFSFHLTFQEHVFLLIPPSLKHSSLCFSETTFTCSFLAACLFPVQAHHEILHFLNIWVPSTFPSTLSHGQIPLHLQLQWPLAVYTGNSQVWISWSDFSELQMGVYNCLQNTSIHSTLPQKIAPNPNLESQCNGWHNSPPVWEIRNLWATTISLGPYSWSHCYFSISPTHSMSISTILAQALSLHSLTSLCLLPLSSHSSFIQQPGRSFGNTSDHAIPSCHYDPFMTSHCSESKD